MSRVHHGETPTRNNHTTVGQILRALPEGRKKVAVYLCNEDGEHWARRRRGRLEVSPSVQRKRDEHMLRVNEDYGVRSTTA